MFFLKATYALLKRAIRLLEGEESFKRYTVAIGIVFFVIGTMLQLIATFLN